MTELRSVFCTEKVNFKSLKFLNLTLTLAANDSFCLASKT